MLLETVFLDAGGVLVFPNWTRISETLARHGVIVSAENLSRAEYPAKRRLDVGDTIGATTDASRGWLYFDLILTEAGVPLSAATRAALEELNAYHRERNLWEVVPDTVVPALEALRSNGLRLTVVSNANGTLCAHLERLGLARWFDCVLDSFEVGVEKPDPRLFEVALERSGARRDTTIHVGDLYHVDVIGARAAGLRAVLLDKADLYVDADCQRLRSLSELVEAIETGAFS
jgi:HAD superfamily hydrolase (TIGR01509 family)